MLAWFSRQLQRPLDASPMFFLASLRESDGAFLGKGPEVDQALPAAYLPHLAFARGAIAGG